MLSLPEATQQGVVEEASWVCDNPSQRQGDHQLLCFSYIKKNKKQKTLPSLLALWLQSGQRAAVSREDEGEGETSAGVDGQRRFKRGRGGVQPPQLPRKGKKAAGGGTRPRAQLLRMVFSIQEVYLQI